MTILKTQRCVDPRPQVLKTKREARGLSMTALAEAAGISVRTLRRVESGNEVLRKTADLIAAQLGERADTLFVIPKPGAMDPCRTLRLPDTEEWQVEELLGSWIPIANGLVYRVCRMRHKTRSDRWGRGKFYGLQHLRADERAKRHHLLERHCDVCDRVGRHANLPDNVSTVSTLDGDGWWVIDRWVEGETLAELLERGEVAIPTLGAIARDMLVALAILEANEIVFRELSPSRVIVTPDGRAVLTDFELAKLWDGNPSVRPDKWPESPYRAPEVEIQVFDYRADLYSWGRIVTHALLGTLPSNGADRIAIGKSNLSKSVRAMISQTLAILPSDRPTFAKDVLAAMSEWPT